MSSNDTFLDHIHELRDTDRGVGMLVFFNDEDMERYFRLKERTGKSLDELVSEGLKYYEDQTDYCRIVSKMLDKGERVCSIEELIKED